MKLTDICSLVEGEVVCGRDALDKDVDYGFASDLMSDVLTLKVDNFMMITGLSNIQSVRTAEMSDVPAIMLCRSKHATADMIKLAHDNGMVVIETPFSVFRAAGVLYAEGLKPVY